MNKVIMIAFLFAFVAAASAQYYAGYSTLGGYGYGGYAAAPLTSYGGYYGGAYASPYYGGYGYYKK